MKKEISVIIVLFCMMVCFGYGQERDRLITSQSNFKIYKRAVDSTFYIADQQETIRYDQLFYAAMIGTEYHIAKKKDNYGVLSRHIMHDDPYHEDPPFLELMSIPKAQADAVYFLNFETAFEDNDCTSSTDLPLIVIMEQNKKYRIQATPGLIGAAPSEWYDTILKDNRPEIRVKKGPYFGFYNITKLRYTRLDAFVYHLAYFELEDGRQGYLDRKGDEYYPYE